MPRLHFRPRVHASRPPGRIYLVKGIGQDAYKIGSSKKLAGRMRYFHTNLPFKVELIHVIEAPNPVKLEREFHKLFASKRINGEWFRLDEADVELFKNHSGAVTNDEPRAVSRRSAKRRTQPGHPGL